MDLQRKLTQQVQLLVNPKDLLPALSKDFQTFVNQIPVAAK